MPDYVKKQYRTILNKLKNIDPWFWCKYTLNPYQGCQHDCCYCDARSRKYYLHSDFEKTILVKKNAHEIPDRRIRGSRTLLPDVVAMAGVCDSYQPAEEKFGVTQKCLMVLNNHNFPVFISTKSPLVLKDADILSHIGKKTKAVVSFTITTTDNEVSKFLETRAPLPEERFRVLRELKEKYPSVKTGVNFMPVIPFLQDSEENIRNVIETASECGADYVLTGPGMTLRDHQALWFLKKLKEKFPELIPKYENLYRFNYSPENYTGSYSPKRNYIHKIALISNKIPREYGVKERIPRYIPDDFRKENYILSEKLFGLGWERKLQRKSHGNYEEAGMKVQNLNVPISDILAKGNLSSIGNFSNEIMKIIENELDLKWEQKKLFK